MGWNRRAWWLAWPYAAVVMAIWLDATEAVTGTALAIVPLCLVAPLINSFFVLFTIQHIPPLFDASESAEQRAKRSRLTKALTIYLAVGIPFLLFFSCLASLGPARR
jgi:hypothetical protein